jgi:hypothetical protein
MYLLPSLGDSGADRRSTSSWLSLSAFCDSHLADSVVLDALEHFPVSGVSSLLRWFHDAVFPSGSRYLRKGTTGDKPMANKRGLEEIFAVGNCPAIGQQSLSVVIHSFRLLV